MTRARVVASTPEGLPGDSFEHFPGTVCTIYHQSGPAWDRPLVVDPGG
jgi:hypothetical protein